MFPSADEWDASAICREVFTPLGARRHYQGRILLCEGPSLLAWFGAIHEELLDERQASILSTVAAHARARLSLERKVRDAPRAFAALDCVLEQLGRAAFVVGARGEVRHANSAAKQLLQEDGERVRNALSDARARRPSSLKFQIMPVSEPGAGCWLALLDEVPADDLRIARRVAEAIERWGLSRRQGEVLGLVARGVSNACIAQSLGIAERTVEFHVTHLFDRAGVESRAALTAAVLASV